MTSFPHSGLPEGSTVDGKCPKMVQVRFYRKPDLGGMLLPFGHLPNLPVRLGVLSGDPGLKKEHKKSTLQCREYFP